MLSKGEAKMRMCVLKVSQKPNWTFRDWMKWRFLWRFFSMVRPELAVSGVLLHRRRLHALALGK